jgi:hypothetical protein
MIQELITYLIISVAVISLIYKILSFFGVVGSSKASVGKCAGCSGSCGINSPGITERRSFSKPNKYQFYL